MEPTRSALDLYRALPKRYQRAALVALARGQELSRDRWPTVPILLATAREFGVDKRKLAAMFGIVTLPISNARNHVTYDAVRGGEPPLYFVYDPALKPFYDYFRASVAMDDEPLHRRPLVYGWGVYLPKERKQRVERAYHRYHARAEGHAMTAH